MASTTIDDLPGPAAKHLLKLAVKMRAAQRQFYASSPQSDERKKAFQKARNAEAEFDRATREVE